MPTEAHDPAFPCSLTVHVPFPSHRLARTALRALEVDPELSALVRRSFALVAGVPGGGAADTRRGGGGGDDDDDDDRGDDEEEAGASVLATVYEAATNRMLRVAVNGFFESLGTVMQVMQELDVDAVGREHEPGVSLEGAQGVEPGSVAGGTG